MEFDFTVIARAGLTQDEFSQLVSVSRVTVNMWVRGKVQPHRYVRDKVKWFVGHLEDAISMGYMPIGRSPTKITKAQRLEAIKTVLVASIKNARANAP